MQHNPRPAAFDARVLSERPYLNKIARRYDHVVQDRSDTVQETICLALSRWEGYQPDANFRSWLAYVMREVCARKYKYQKSAITHALYEELPADLSVSATQEGASSARSCLAALSDSRGDRALVRLAVGDTLAEIGTGLGVSRERVRQITDVARGRFAKRVGWKMAA